MGIIFSILCGCLNLIGKPFIWDYQKTSVYICIHLWPLLCVAASLAMLGVAMATGNVVWITVCTIFAALNTFGYWVVIRHYYPGTIKEIFELCMAELIVLAKEWHTTYPVVNLVIYVLLFAIIMSMDCCFILLMLYENDNPC